jgi:hypothetical protein
MHNNAASGAMHKSKEAARIDSFSTATAEEARYRMDKLRSRWHTTLHATNVRYCIPKQHASDEN